MKEKHLIFIMLKYLKIYQHSNSSLYDLVDKELNLCKNLFPKFNIYKDLQSIFALGIFKTTTI